MILLMFKYEADRQYFADQLSGGSVRELEENYADLFDFRNPSIKRQEFNRQRSKLFKILVERANGVCEICGKTKGTEIDHVVPLSTNILSKKLRNVGSRRINGALRKAKSESYGSNHLSNLQLACKACNRKKWNSP